jgi:hypothetical protein
MLINLIPDFFAVLNSADRVAAYINYYETHRPRLAAYWHNYVFDPDSEHFQDVVRMTAYADRSDLRAMLERTDVVTLARQTEARCIDLLGADVDFDVVLMVGVGGANAGELVVAGRGAAFVCLEHFTGVANPETQGLGLDPELIPMWLPLPAAARCAPSSKAPKAITRTGTPVAMPHFGNWWPTKASPS